MLELFPDERSRQLRAEMATLIERRNALYDTAFVDVDLEATATDDQPLSYRKAIDDSVEYTVILKQCDRMEKGIDSLARQICEIEENNAAQERARLADLPLHGHNVADVVACECTCHNDPLYGGDCTNCNCWL